MPLEGKVMMELKTKEDTFAHIFKTLHEGEEDFIIIERDDEYFDVGTPKVYLSQYKVWSYIERKAMDYVKGRALDIRCGTGSIDQTLTIGKPFEVSIKANKPLERYS